MAENSAIEWTDHTFNPWHGCVKISEGCRNCYAEARQFGGDWWGKDKPRRFFGEKHWEQPIKWNAEAERLGIRFKVFCGSYCDVFEDGEDLMRARIDLWIMIEQTPHLDWMLLTKRPENISKFYVPFFGMVKPVPNVWLGVSIENQKRADERIPIFLKYPAAGHFISCEPLLEPVNLPLQFAFNAPWLPEMTTIDWVIVGGESGPNARPMNPDWARSIRVQCQEAGVPFFMKQMNKIKPIPDDLFIRQFPEVA